MPEPAHPAVIAANLTDATRSTARRGGTWCRLLVGLDTPDNVRGLDTPSVTVTPAAMAANAEAVHGLVQALSAANPDIEVHLPPPAFPSGPTQADIDQTRRELERDTDELLARRMMRRIRATIADSSDALTDWVANVPSSHRAWAAREALRRRIRTGMTAPDAMRSVAADYAAGRLS